MAGPLTPEEAGRWLSDLFEEHGRMVYGVRRILLRDPQDAEDASQQTFLSAHRSLLAGTRPNDPAAWLGTIARNECRSRIRSRANAPLALVGDRSAPMQVEDLTAGREEIAALCAALAELPHQQREAIVLREFYGLSYDEVRAALGISGPAVESLIFRARKRLQQELRPARVASGAVALPIALHTSLARAVPGFATTHRVGILAKLGGAPLAAKLAAATVAVTVAGVAGTAAVAHQSTHAPASKPVVASKPTVPQPARPVSFVAPSPGSDDVPDSAAPGAKHRDRDGSPSGQAGAAASPDDMQADAQQDDQDQSSGAAGNDDGNASASDQDTGDSGNTGTADDNSGNNRSSDPSSGDSDSSGSQTDGNG